MQKWNCKSSKCSSVAYCKGYTDVYGEDNLAKAVSKYGPVRLALLWQIRVTMAECQRRMDRYTSHEHNFFANSAVVVPTSNDCSHHA